MQERWNQVVQELHEIEGSEQPTWFKQAPHGLFLNVVVSNLINDYASEWNIIKLYWESHAEKRKLLHLLHCESGQEKPKVI